MLALKFAQLSEWCELLARRTEISIQLMHLDTKRGFNFANIARYFYLCQ